MSIEKMVDKLLSAIKFADDMLLDNFRTLEELDLYIKYWDKKDVIERFKKHSIELMKFNKKIITEKMVSLKLLNEIKTETLSIMTESILSIKK